VCGVFVPISRHLQEEVRQYTFISNGETIPYAGGCLQSILLTKLRAATKIFGTPKTLALFERYGWILQYGY
jgi:hypothetical protein